MRYDPDRDRLPSAIVADARARRTTKVYVTGTLRRFDAPTNAMKQTGIYLEVNASSGVVLEGSPQLPAPITREDAIACKHLIWRATHGVSRGFDSYHPLQSPAGCHNGSPLHRSVGNVARRVQSATNTSLMAGSVIASAASAN